ncbi:hypothetical protein C7377_1550 [Balneicella halophila]|uniref:Metalloprotease n=1 Tax=Balneicella halophila TaxID=1537566 RepID=A0A7L4UMZ3_BALHA|nr:neutral zinc metallopeptidase [Balneicella halophila]PVX49912.1 hypothetical protein C7377_1550 [Balneicella halophila]
MKWRGKRQSGNIEDRRGMSNKGRVAIGGGAIGIIILLFQIFGGDTGRQLAPVLEQLNQQTQVQQTAESRKLTQEEKEIGQFVDVILTSTDEVWTKIFRKYELGVYQKPTLVLFSQSTQSACGGASAATGPFYCPADRKLYIDMDFFKKLRTDFGAKGGDFAVAYVIAHEVGHHVQTLLGTSQKVHKAQQNSRSEAEANRYSVALELQADFYSGLWAHYSKDYLEVNRGDIEEAMDAARAVGDDAIQKRMQGHIVPDSFTHGSSKQRMKWFMKGFQTGDLRQHDTFSEEL